MFWYYEANFLLLNIIASIGAISGSIVWTIDNDMYTKMGGFGFFWFVSVLSLLVGIGGFVYIYILKLEFDTDSAITMSMLLFVLWLAASAVVASYLQECAMENLVCNGEIVATTFGFLNVIIWLTAAVWVSRLANEL